MLALVFFSGLTLGLALTLMFDGTPTVALPFTFALTLVVDGNIATGLGLESGLAFFADVDLVPEVVFVSLDTTITGAVARAVFVLEVGSVPRFGFAVGVGFVVDLGFVLILTTGAMGVTCGVGFTLPVGARVRG
jgi:hypothetical protein